MQIIPAIDVLNGTIVRLAQGDFARVTPYDGNPLAIARRYRKEGAGRLHLVNLSAARSGETDERFLALIGTLSREMDVQAGGGIRTLRDAQRVLDAGATAAVIGTMLFSDPDAARAAVLLFGAERIIAALDVAGKEVKIAGWRTGSGFSLDAAVRRAAAMGIRRILVTDIARDGMRKGPNAPLYEGIRRRFPSLHVTASGGARNAADIRALARSGCDTVVVGKALLDRSVTLSALIAACRTSCADGRSSPPSDQRGALAIRVIPCLDVTGERVVKGTSFQSLRDAGDPVALAKRYCEEGADELVFLDITATSNGRKTAVELASRVADAVNIPFTIGGGVRSVADARRLLAAGADKVAVNSAAVRNPSLLEDMAKQLGRANTVCAIDARRRGKEWPASRSSPRNGSEGWPASRSSPRGGSEGWVVLTRGGRDDTGIDALAWAQEAARRGAGELLVTSFDRDGTKEGFDTALLSAIKARVSVPVIASGGGGSLETFVRAVRDGKADAVLAASVFHFGSLSIRDVKNALRSASFPVRL